MKVAAPRVAAVSFAEPAFSEIATLRNWVNITVEITTSFSNNLHKKNNNHLSNRYYNLCRDTDS